MKLSEDTVFWCGMEEYHVMCFLPVPDTASWYHRRDQMFWTKVSKLTRHVTYKLRLTLLLMFQENFEQKQREDGKKSIFNVYLSISMCCLYI